jgi:purine-nucleoside phosphorylase
MTLLVDQLEETKRYLLANCGPLPKVSIVLGSGLSELLREMTIESEVPYSEIPHVKRATVEGHAGKLVVGDLKGTRVACMQGRLHFYEGYSMHEVVFPFRALAYSGVETFLVTNAAGGLREDMKPMDLCLIRDHINLTGTNPLIGKNEEKLGPRFPDMSDIYDKGLRARIKALAERLGVDLKEGVYVGFHGPSYETPAEIRMCRQMGGDVVGMSTVPEAIALRHMGKRVVGISFVSNLAAGVTDQHLVHSEVLENAKRGYGNFSRFVIEVLREIAKD